MVRLRIRYLLIALLPLLGLPAAPLSAAITQSGNVEPDVNYWNYSAGYVGRTSDGELRIDSGSIVDSWEANIGYEMNVTGTVAVSGTWSRWINKGTLNVGQAGNGSLSIAAGGNVAGATGRVAVVPGSTGTVTVTGEASSWTGSAGFVVGIGGKGTLIIEEGGYVHSGANILGYFADAVGTANVTGTGSKWTYYTTYLGYSGSGMLTIEDGGQVSGTHGYLGGGSSSSGAATISGAGSEWTNRGDLYVGQTGSGWLTVQNQAKVSNWQGYVGDISGSTGEVKVTGDGTVWTNESALFVGRYGSGKVTITGGGLVQVDGFLTLGYGQISDDFIHLATGGKLALRGDSDESINQFLRQMGPGRDGVRYWDATLADWAPLTAATYGTDYTLEYLTTGDLAGYTLLTVGRVGDFDNDGDVDGRDFLAWQRHPELGSLADWQNAYGSDSLLAATTVPEPSCLALLLGLLLLSGRVRKDPP